MRGRLLKTCDFKTIARRSDSVKKILSGLAASPGTVRGRVRLVKTLEERVSFKEGDVLVTRITDPTMTSMMNRASAIICDIGGMTSHPSIVSREMGIPCVVATKNATNVLRDGMRVFVDGDKGVVYDDSTD